MVPLFALQAQERWSLERCIRHAQQNSLNVRNAQLDVKQSELDLTNSQQARLPDLNLSSTGRYTFGRTIDPSTNEFATTSRFDNSWQLDANATIYNGNSINNGIKQSKFDLGASKATLEQANNDIGLQVANAYLSILLAEEQLENANKRKTQTQQQLDQTDKLIQAGTRPEADRYDILAQLATDEQSIVTQQNSVDISYLNLKQLLELQPDHDLVIERPNIKITDDQDPASFALKAIYNSAYNNQPQIRASQLQLESAKLGVDIARARMLPSLTVFGNLNSFFSSRADDFENPNFDNAFVDQRVTPVLIDGAQANLTEFVQRGVEFPTVPFGTQLDNNFGQIVGLSLRVPIYNRGQNRTAMERARLNIIRTELSNLQVEQQLKTDIQRAIADAKAAKKQLEASQKSVEALNIAFSNAEKRYKLGAINTFEYTTAKNNLDQAEVNLIVAKYDYLFKLKVVDFYEGKPITLE